MSREWIWYPRNIQLSTPLGDIFLNITDRNHIYVDGGSNGKYIVVNKIEYQTSFHLMRQEDGSYQLDGDGYGIRGTRTFRHSKGNYNADQMSSAAIEKVKKVLIPIINEWASSNPEIFDVAEHAHINNKIFSLEKEALVTTEKLQLLQQELLEKRTEIEQLTKSIDSNEHKNTH